MICDLIANARQYYALNPLFERAFAWYASINPEELADGRHEIDGDRLFAMVQRLKARAPASINPEFHRRYIDIQLCARGVDHIGYIPLERCQQVHQPYNAERDIGFMLERPEATVLLQRDSFVLLHPQDAHSPSSGPAPIDLLKVVIKVAVDPQEAAAPSIQAVAYR